MFGSDILMGILGNSAYDIIKKIVKKNIGTEDEQIIQGFITSIKKTSVKFFDAFGDKYGTKESSFLSIEKNWEVLLGSIFYGADEIKSSHFNVSGLGISRDVVLEGVKNYIAMLHQEMSTNFQLNKVLTEKRQMRQILDTTKQIKETTDSLFEISSHTKFPKDIVNQLIIDEVTILRQSRFFQEYETVRNSIALAKKLTSGELSGGSDTERCRALAWCARFLSQTEEIHKAEEYLKLAKELGSCHEVLIADAFIFSKKGDKQKALSDLAKINTPMSRTAALMVVSHHEVAEKAVEWLNNIGLETIDLDSEGKYFLISLQLQLARWDSTQQSIEKLTNSDFFETPILHRVTAITHLIKTVPTELRTVILNQLPLNTKNFPLASDSVALGKRRLAKQHFLCAADRASKFSCNQVATICDEFALWLELTDPDEFEKGRFKLETKLRDPNTALRYVHLAVQFGIKLDIGAVEQNIEREIALYGGLTQDAAFARFALTFTQNSPHDAAKYLSRHFDQLSKYLDKRTMRSMQVEMYSHASLPEKANECLQLLIKEGISEVEENRLRNIIAEVEGTDPIEVRKVQFNQTNSLSDLIILVDELETSGEWDELCEYGKILFERTSSTRDAECYATGLINEYKTEQLVNFCKRNLDLLNQSNTLQLFYCWSLYYEGELIEARTELEKISRDQRNTNYRTLQVNLGITLGDWQSLLTYIEEEYFQRETRSAQDLISVAQLAVQLKSPYAKKMIFEAVNKEEDAQIYTAAYFLATSAGWEDDTEVSQWLYKASQFSNDDGPLRKMSLKDVLDMKPDWDRQESETWRLLSHGEIPIFLAAQTLNRSLFNMLLFQALSNQNKRDPRYRGIIPVYSGKNGTRVINNIKSIGLDASTLVTLSFMKLLDKTIDAFDEAYIPHSTLRWLFEEKQKVSFHQPSRINDAHKIRDLISNDVIEKFVPSTNADRNLIELVGDELAMLIAEAEKGMGNEDNCQRIVVRPYPVHCVASLMEDEADLSKYSSIMSSCTSLVGKLRETGQLTLEEENRALAYLQLHEKPWPNQPEIKDGAIIFLDDLAMTYFLHLGLLNKLKSAGLRPIASPREVSMTNELISYAKISTEIDGVIEQIRNTINNGIETGKVKVGRKNKGSDQKDQSIFEHPTAEIMSIVRFCDAIIIDDRFLNHHEFITEGNLTAQVLTSVDILDLLVSKETISSNDRLEKMTLLRRSGYIFVPINEDELTTHLLQATVKGDKVLETAELKAIRENILHIRMINWLQLPKEATWLDGTLKVFDRVLKGLWKEGADLSKVKVQSHWILTQIDVRGWAHCIPVENRTNIVTIGRGPYILMLLSPPTDVPKYIKEEYWNWIEERVLLPIKEQFSDLYNWLVKWHTDIITEFANKKYTEREIQIDSSNFRSLLVTTSLELMPPLIRKSILEKKDLLEEYGLKLNVTHSLNGTDVSFDRSDLFDAIRNTFSNSEPKDIIDNNGVNWLLRLGCVEGETPKLSISSNTKNINLPDFFGLHPNHSVRLQSLDEVTTNFNLLSHQKWRNILLQRAFQDDELDEYQNDIHHTPVYMMRSIRREFKNGSINVSSLVPSSRIYYERLVGRYDGSLNVREYATRTCRQFFEQLSEWIHYDGFLFSLLLSAHSSLTTEINVNNMDNKELVRALDFLILNGDRISQLGAIEVGFRILPERPDIEPALITLIEQIRDDDVEDTNSRFKLLSSLFILVDGELSRMRIFSSEPPFYRRLASLAQVALISRQLSDTDLEINQFNEWAFNSRGEQYYMQTFADMRLEPRWNPDFASASQMKAEFFGRIMIAATNNEKNLIGSRLHELVLSNRPESLQSHSNSLYPYFSGPLDSEEFNPILPIEFSKTVEEQLSEKEVLPSSFVALLNFSLLFKIDSYHAEMAAKTIKRGKYTITNLEKKSQFFTILNGLASVAAITRSKLLAEELKILIRKYRGDSQFTLSVDEAMRICLEAAASNSDLNNWIEFVGDCVTEFAFDKLELNEAETLHSRLQYLLNVVPELWITCGRADAALKALIHTQH